MIEDEEGARPRRAGAVQHVVGDRLDDLSVQDFDERIALLEAEIARLRAAKEKKVAALGAAASVFRV